MELNDLLSEDRVILFVKVRIGKEI